MRISWHGHACVIIKTLSTHQIIIDPFITGNVNSDLNPETLNVDFIILTHAHSDHIGDTEQLARNNDALIIANDELAKFFAEKGYRTHGMNLGGSFSFPFGKVKLTLAYHSSTYNGIPLGQAAGVIVDDGASRIYHAGDTALFSDMKLIEPVSVALLPIGDNYTMGIDDAVKAASFIDAEQFIPIHYNTFAVIKQNPYDFINRLPDLNGYVPEVGEIIDL